MDTRVTSTEDTSSYQPSGLLGVFSHLTHLGARLEEEGLEEGVGVKLVAAVAMISLVSLLTTLAACLAARLLRKPSSTTDLLEQGEQGAAGRNTIYKLRHAVHLVEVDDDDEIRNL